VFNLILKDVNVRIIIEVAPIEFVVSSDSISFLRQHDILEPSGHDGKGNRPESS